MRILILASLLAAGCGPVLLVHPKTGERVTCDASRRHPFLDRMKTSACASQYEGLGFVRASDLTREQRDSLLSKPTPQRIEQDITIRPGKAEP
jgi:hypothetical protein